MPESRGLGRSCSDDATNVRVTRESDDRFVKSSLAARATDRRRPSERSHFVAVKNPGERDNDYSDKQE